MKYFLIPLLGLLLILGYVESSFSQSSIQKCMENVQGKIAWNYKGNKQWGRKNLERFAAAPQTLGDHPNASIEPCLGIPTMAEEKPAGIGKTPSHYARDPMMRLRPFPALPSGKAIKAGEKPSKVVPLTRTTEVPVSPTVKPIHFTNICLGDLSNESSHCRIFKRKTPLLLLSTKRKPKGQKVCSFQPVESSE